MTLLHIEHGGEHTVGGFFKDVVLGSFLDTLTVVLFLFVTYLVMELIEHKANERAKTLMRKTGVFGPLVGGLLGIIPQCGFSVMASNFYTGRVITLGTIVAVFLATSDEMLPILISERVGALPILTILGYKIVVSILVGFIVDLVLHIIGKDKEDMHIERVTHSDDEHHCHGGALLSALHHTLSAGIFVIIVTLTINTLIFFIGSESIKEIMYDKPFVSHLVSTVLGLVPNCAISIALTEFAVDGYITAGTMLSGLFSGAGIGLFLLFKTNKNLVENIIFTLILLVCGTLFGLLFDVFGFASILTA